MPNKKLLPDWVKIPIDLKRVGEWINTGRDLAALLFIPFLCLYGVFLVAILWRVFGKADRDVAVQLAVVNYLGATLIGLIILIGLGVLWLQRRNIPSLSITTPMGTMTMGSGDAAQSTLAAAVIDTLTPESAPSVAAAVAGTAPSPSKAVVTDAADAAVGAEAEIV